VAHVLEEQQVQVVLVVAGLEQLQLEPLQAEPLTPEEVVVVEVLMLPIQ
jgi:hypothetical protein